MKLFERQANDARTNAQRNLMGRTHYVNDDTLRWHKSRILQTVVADEGLLFALIESCAADMNNTKRIFRPVIFDVFGTVLYRPKLEAGFSSHKTAEKAMWRALNEIDAKAVTNEAIIKAENYHAIEMKELRAKLETVKTNKEVKDEKAA
jgi:hypothetical protein